MAVNPNSLSYITLADLFEVNGKKVYAAYANGVQVYPEDTDETNEPWVVKVAGEIELTFSRLNRGGRFTTKASCVCAFTFAHKPTINVGTFVPYWSLSHNNRPQLSTLPEYYTANYEVVPYLPDVDGTHSVKDDRNDISECGNAFHVDSVVKFDTDDIVGQWQRDSYWVVTGTQEAESILNAANRTALSFPRHGASYYHYERQQGGINHSVNAIQVPKAFINLPFYETYTYSCWYSAAVLRLNNIPVTTMTGLSTTESFHIATIPYTRLLYSNVGEGDEPTEEAPYTAKHAYESELP